MEGDGLLHPRGPLPPEIYWRRRAVVLIGALALIFLIAKCAPGGGADPKKASSTSAPSSSGSSTAKPTAKPTTKASATPKASPSTTAKPAASTTAKASPTAPAAPAACKPPALQVSVKANAASYAAGVSPVLTMTIKNAGAVPCTRDLGAGATELKITSGADRIWSSDDCVKDAGKKPTLLKAGEVRTVEVTWNRKRSKPTGECIGADAKTGRYRVQGRLGDLLTVQDSFLLS